MFYRFLKSKLETKNIFLITLCVMQLLLINDVTFYGHIQINVKRIYLENDLWDDVKKEILLKVSETVPTQTKFLL